MVDVLGIAGLVAGAAALLELPYVEMQKRPKLQIQPVAWQPRGPLPSMTFASAQVLNMPLRGPLARFLHRRAAEACEATIEFFYWGSQDRPFDSFKGRWDSHPEPLKVSYVTTSSPLLPGSVPTSLPTGYAGGTIPTSYTGTVPTSYLGSAGGGQSGTTATWHVEYDPSIDTPQQDISVGSDRGQISVAILKDGNAYAFANESYETPPPNNLCKPEWKLAMGKAYRIEVCVKGSNVEHKQIFKLEYRNNDFADFKLQKADDTELR